eukprot:CAMPEP_0174755894 /NCGR_PEP_ID=MMETSP1094-20130205/106481_1 /TAXON_ID=156173 /ORGANISM="Chrysochromulina brevifilum, Strain UTEX LB 985" /LENGTH=102 /DNA_ID=CAMNT_0015961795 /DNA_START=529 /DNA_END=837 /DNA_ORIENTATION=-
MPPDDGDPRSHEQDEPREDAHQVVRRKLHRAEHNRTARIMRYVHHQSTDIWPQASAERRHQLHWTLDLWLHVRGHMQEQLRIDDGERDGVREDAEGDGSDKE